MGTLRFQFEFPDEQRTDSIFEHLEHVPDDFREPLEKMAEDFWDHEKRTFDDEGPGWEPLSPKYAKRKARQFPGAPILVRSGALEASLTSGTDPNAIYEMYPDHMLLGTSLKVPSGKYNLGMIHQFGATITRGGKTWRIPKRPPIKMKTALYNKWRTRMVHWLRDEIGWEG